MLEHDAHYIGGQWQPSSGPDTIAVVNAAYQSAYPACARYCPFSLVLQRVWS
jgi:hypothetical protein